MGLERVRMWRPVDQDRLLLMAGQTTGYVVDPHGDYVFGIVMRNPMRSQRGRERRVVLPGQLVAWDPSQAHSGAAVDDRPWSSRLMVIEMADLSALAGDSETVLPANIGFPEPVLSDPALARSFVAMHRTLEEPSTRLERDERLTGWLHAMVERARTAPQPASPANPRDDKALRRALDYLGDQAERNVGLDELAGAVGLGKFRLIRLFRDRTGLSPHALQIAHRIRKARRLLEQGLPIAGVAAATGFADQAHLHRHFRRTLGITPGQYRQRFTGEAKPEPGP